MLPWQLTELYARLHTKTFSIWRQLSWTIFHQIQVFFEILSCIIHTFGIIYHLYTLRPGDHFRKYCAESPSHRVYKWINIVQSKSGVTVLNNIVGDYEQCRQHNNIQSCSDQPSSKPHLLDVMSNDVKGHDARKGFWLMLNEAKNHHGIFF